MYVSKKSDPHEHANIKWKECRKDESDLQKKHTIMFELL